MGISGQRCSQLLQGLSVSSCGGVNQPQIEVGVAIRAIERQRGLKASSARALSPRRW